MDELARHGLAEHFEHVGLSERVGIRKPDVRIFLGACEALSLEPSACAMVGDRIDNDIVPARALGMRAIRFVTGRHARQRPRSWLEAPDAEVHDVEELRAVLEGW
jgi:FMN phosphatase YigB (HAD superfamily)